MGTKRVFLAKITPIILLLGLFGVIGVACLALMFNVYWEENKGPYRSITSLADLDGDGDLDVIDGRTRWESVSTSFAGVKLWINQGGGKFIQSEQELPGGFSGAAADVDGDGDADLLILDGYDLFLLLNQGGAQGGTTGMFKVHNPIEPWNEWRGHADMGGSILLVDLNKDGAVDGFVAGCCYGGYSQSQTGDMSLVPSTSWVWINEWDPRGWLVRHTLKLPEMDGLPVRAAALGDLDGNGTLDVFAAIGKPTAGEAHSLADRVLLNDGSGKFSDSGQRLGETDSLSVALGDVDGDEDLDALVGTGNGAVLWINQGGAQGGNPGVFAAGKTIGGGQITTVFLSDLNGDGRLDALTGGVDRADIWWNAGLGNFNRSEQFFRYTERYGLAVGDFNGDGYVDIFAGTHDEKEYKVWLNQGNGIFR